MDPTTTTLYGVLCGSLGSLATTLLAKFFDGRSSAQSRRSDELTKFRESLQTELKGMREENKAAKHDLDEWKLKFFDLQAESNSQKISLQQALDDLREFQALQLQHQQLQTDHRDLTKEHEELLQHYHDALEQIDRLMGELQEAVNQVHELTGTLHSLRTYQEEKEHVHDAT